ncbi:hypothetical protein RU09_11865 [Microbacterium sp. MEJ108Y]|uniref:hypothetical protein n=1 Tax=Microbacterium sp. MEJ108Y TaxID=1587523 RepID=UPI0005ACB223|nr:hypothetical protein [Microbacterium sp. MEJ108Y]KIP90170.1 hypothetical protein RU09_11865 [Microbacterium sp. MEJ108Y]
MNDNEKLIESVRDYPTITRMAHVTQIEKIGELRDALIAAESHDGKLEWPDHWTANEKLRDLHARWHQQAGNLLGREACGWQRCEFWDAAEFTLRLADVRVIGREPQGEPSDALDLDRLEKLANAATPGPWEFIFGGPEQDEDGSWYEPTESGVRSGDWENDFPHADAEFIAAIDPQTVLAVIAALRAAGGVR